MSQTFWKINAKIQTFLSVKKYTCVFYYIKIWKHLEKSWDLVIFALILQKKIEKVWNIAKFRKNQGKYD